MLIDIILRVVAERLIEMRNMKVIVLGSWLEREPCTIIDRTYQMDHHTWTTLRIIQSDEQETFWSRVHRLPRIDTAASHQLAALSVSVRI